MTPEQGAAIQAGAQVLSQGIQSYAAAKMSKKDRAFSREMYDKQRADNMAMWNLNNEYNSPQSQMNRLKEAGLNANLIYGASAPGNSSAQPQGATVMNMGPRPVPKIDLGQVAGAAMSTYYDIQMKQAQIDNLKADKTIKDEQAALMWTNNLFTSTRNRHEQAKLSETLLKFDNDRMYSADERRARLNLVKKDLDLKGQQHEFNARTMNDRVDAVKLINDLRENQSKIQQYQMSLQSMGLQPNDPWYSRLMRQFMHNLTGMNIQDMTPEGIENHIRKTYNIKGHLIK